MSSRQPAQYNDPSRRSDGRPTLPPIRDIFGAELSQAVPSSQTSSRRPSSSSSPHIPLARLALADDPRAQAPVSGSRAPRQHPSYPDARSASPAAHARPVTESSSYRPILPQTHPAQYGPPYARSTPIMPRHIDPNALATSGYPYAASQPLAPYQQGSQAGAATYDPTGLDRTTSATGRYECGWCGKGFTRPSSLKIHMNTHTGERPYVCPFEGCGRSFSVQSNMRRHARVHTRNADSQADQDQDQDDEDEDDEVGSGSQSRSHSRGDSGSQPSSNGHGGHARS